ncbi:MAG TPA: hypothetical protein VH325_15920 [Bryobacteraceae bacterium]|nr:hypothetical protein [Bryobacteraceae bacterium]
MNTSASAAASETFRAVRTAGYAEALRGISFTPGTNTTPPTQIPYPVTRSRPVYNLIAGTYTQNITVRNNTNSTLTGPVYLELQDLTYRLKYGAVVNGIPAIQLAASGTTWNPGASVTVTATFERPFNGFLRYNPVVTQ